MAESLASDLVISTNEKFVLHGDLHHDNILSDTDQRWIAIDPKGVIGDAEYEIGAFMRNRIDVDTDDGLKTLIGRRVDQFSEELQLDHQRVRDWALVHSVLSAWWSFEDEGKVGFQSISCAQALSVL